VKKLPYYEGATPWEAEDGSKRGKEDLVADNVQFLSCCGGAENEEEGGPLGSRA
jgi:hypothetical protein